MIKDENIDAITIAHYFLTKSEMSPKKLQKLVYYSYSWFIALNNENENKISNILFKEKPEAWLHGPVFRTLYNEYKEYKWHNIKKVNKKIKFENNDLNEFLNEIYNLYSRYSADQLEYMTHKEFPWINARKGVNSLCSSTKKINSKDIFKYYNSLVDE